MGRVNVLDKHTAELIAAGEVVERPSSVVKELVENSIDAGATAVTVEIKSGGVRYIRITDNGEGIDREDVPKAFLRHATSKISKGEDLEAIATLGFRGEALASIAAVARVELITATSSEEPGTHYVIEGGDEVDYSECGCARGTTIVVRDLFYNTPARLKFLKTDVKEGVAVAALLDRLALSHPEVAFRLVREGKQTLATPGDGKLASAVYAVFGREFFEGLIPVKFDSGSVKVEGYICKPTEARPNTVMQTFFINGRYCRSKTMQAALEAAYKGSIMVGKHPACVLYTVMDCSVVDVNVHPAKLEVRFTNEKPVFDAVYAAVKNTLNACDSRREIQMAPQRPDPSLFAPPRPEAPTQTTISQIAAAGTAPAARQETVSPAKPRTEAQPEDGLLEKISSMPVQPEQYAGRESILRDAGLGLIRTEKTTPPPVRMWPKGSIDITAEELTDDRPVLARHAAEETKTDENAPVFDISEDNNTNSIEESAPEQPAPQPEEAEQAQPELPDFRIVGEVFDTYILLESGDEMVVIDKHAAHERLIYEQLRQNVSVSGASGGGSQLLLEPVAVTLDKQHCQAVLDNAGLLHSSGFGVEEFGPGTILVRSAPMMIPPAEIPQALAEIAGNLGVKKDALVTERMDRALHTIACRAAIKGGSHSSREELAALVARLMANPDVRYCPHGRPIYTVLKRRELEKSFGRIQ